MGTEKNTLVSVITIFYNGEKFIKESVQSVLDQTYDNWELLLIDDGSYDKSTDITKAYAKKYNGKIKYIEHSGHQNKGMSASRNLGIKHCAGDLICFLDADDVWMPNKLAEQTRIMNEHPDVSMLYGNTLIWYSWNKEMKNKDFIRRLGVKPNIIHNPAELLAPFLVSAAAVPATCSIMCRKDLFKKICFEDSFTGVYEDQAFYYKVCLSENVYAADNIWDKYRQHDNSACAAAEKRNELYTLRLKFLQWLWKYIKSQTNIPIKVSLAVYQEYWRNTILEKRRDSASNTGIRLILKWLLRFEQLIFPDFIRLAFWRSTKTYKLLNVSTGKPILDSRTKDISLNHNE